MQYIVDLEGLTKWFADGAAEAAIIVGLDLTSLTSEFKKVSVASCIFMACKIGRDLALQIHEQDGKQISEPGTLPRLVKAFRKGVYTVPELYAGMNTDGTSWEKTPDYAGYDWFFDIQNKKPRLLEPAQVIAARLHDTVQELAVKQLLTSGVAKRVVAIMGGHDFKRQTDEGKPSEVYWACVKIARTLTEKGFFVISGGGPGLMEAANLGALLANSADDIVTTVADLLKNADFTDKKWRATAMAARSCILGAWDVQPPQEKWSLGIPTWLYGHEPPNLFASHHSKMFYNSLREDGLVSLANSGIIFFEGNAGTVQEIFQDATQNYYLYAGESPTPMIFFNWQAYWDRDCDDLSWPTEKPMNKRKPLLPLIKQLAIEKKFMDSVFVTQNPSDVVQFIVDADKARTKPRKADFRLRKPSLANI